PAFRDDCVAVFDNMDLTNYANRLPNLSFELYNASGPIPWRVSTFTPTVNGSPPSGGALVCVTYDGTTITTAYYVTETYYEYDYLEDGTPAGNSSAPMDLIEGI